MGWFVLAIMLWLAAVILAIVAVFVSGKTEGGVSIRGISGSAAALCVILGLGLFALAGVKSVPTRNIGVPVSFGAVSSGVFGPGMHETWEPWLNVVHVDETVQTTTFEGRNCLTVRIGGQQTACVDTTIQWKILPGAAGTLYSNYANHGDFMTVITDAVVVREFKQVVNQVLGDYNPITDVSNVTGTNTASSQFTSFGPQILAQMETDIGADIQVKSVLMPYAHFSDSVEAKLQAIQQAFANDAIATENVKVNTENAAAFAKLGTPTVAQLVAQCLTDVKSEAGQLPAGFQCFPGSGSGLALSTGK